MAHIAVPSIDGGRLKAILDGINTFGRCPEAGGYSRLAFSEADAAARAWFAGRMKAEGLKVSRDAAGNVFGRHGSATQPCVMVGSHLDTVPEGGAFDGALGVAVGLECVLALRDSGLELRRAVEVVATSDEEGRFGGMLGSQAMAGLTTPEWLEAASDAGGVRLADAMAARGLDASAVPTAARGDVAAFLEMHIEQGPVLEAEGLRIGIVDRVSGVANIAVALVGISNHSGTTPMDMRADAFAGLAGVAAAIPTLIAEAGTTNSRITVGRVRLHPNFAHTIPGRAEFSLIVRDTDETVMRILCEALEDAIATQSSNHRLRSSLDYQSWLPPVALDPALSAMLAHIAVDNGLRHRVMASGAGHDAQTMQSLCPSGLIFVPSRGGISHAPEEWTDWEPILDGAGLMLSALVRLACE